MAARSQHPAMHDRFQAWMVSHLRAFLFSLGKLYRAPLASLMTLLVITVALALPATLYSLLNNAQQLSGELDVEVRISAFLQESISLSQARQLQTTLRQREDIATVQLIDKDRALELFKKESGMGDALSLLDTNPLPHTLIIQPALSHQDNTALEALRDALQARTEIDQARLDLEWLQRLNAIMSLLKRAVMLIAGMLALAALLVVGNTIRLDILSRKQEIEVAKLIGATDGFIRRPFMYGGFWYGLLSAILALVTVNVLIALLSPAVSELSGLYNTRFTLSSLNWLDTLWLLGLGSLLGLLGSWLAVSRHLNEIQPS